MRSSHKFLPNLTDPLLGGGISDLRACVAFEELRPRLTHASASSLRSPPVRIVIIGGAFAGTCALWGVRERFAQQLAAGDLQVLMVDREPFAGPGLAWDGSITSECQLSNLDVERLELSSSASSASERNAKRPSGL